MSTADAVAREAAWLRTTGDGLPALLAPDGPWQVIQGYWPRTPAARVTGIYLWRPALEERRFTNQRKINFYEFRAHLIWPVGTTTTADPLWETEQAALDEAVDLLLARLRGFVGDHTHGGRFLAAAEAPDPGRILVRFHEPATTAAMTPATLRAEVTYHADDRDFTA